MLNYYTVEWWNEDECKMEKGGKYENKEDAMTAKDKFELENPNAAIMVFYYVYRGLGKGYLWHRIYRREKQGV